MKYPEYRFIIIGLIIAVLLTIAQSHYREAKERRSELKVIPLTLPPDPNPTIKPEIKTTKRGFCRLFNVSGSACEVYYET